MSLYLLGQVVKRANVAIEQRKRDNLVADLLLLKSYPGLTFTKCQERVFEWLLGKIGRMLKKEEEEHKEELDVNFLKSMQKMVEGIQSDVGKGRPSQTASISTHR